MTDDTKRQMWKWAEAGFCFLMTVLVGMMNSQMSRMLDKADAMQSKISHVSVEMAQVRSELDVVKPADVLSAVHEMSLNTVSRQELREAIKETAPWANDRESWTRWRQEVDKQIRELQLHCRREN